MTESKKPLNERYDAELRFLSKNVTNKATMNIMIIIGAVASVFVLSLFMSVFSEEVLKNVVYNIFKSSVLLVALITIVKYVYKLVDEYTSKRLSPPEEKKVTPTRTRKAVVKKQ